MEPPTSEEPPGEGSSPRPLPPVPKGRAHAIDVEVVGDDDGVPPVPAARREPAADADEAAAPDAAEAEPAVVAAGADEPPQGATAAEPPADRAAAVEDPTGGDPFAAPVPTGTVVSGWARPGEVDDAVRSAGPDAGAPGGAREAEDAAVGSPAAADVPPPPAEPSPDVGATAPGPAVPPPASPPPPPPPPPPPSPGPAGGDDGPRPGSTSRRRLVAVGLVVLVLAAVAAGVVAATGDDEGDPGRDDVASEETTTSTTRPTTTTRRRPAAPPTTSAAAAPAGASATPAAGGRAPARPARYGDDAALDALWDRCAGGDMRACDQLWASAERGTEYEAFGDTCGNRNAPGRFCEDLYGNPAAVGYGDDPRLDRLWDACAAGDFASCDALYYESGIGTDYERFGTTCGGRNQPTASLCADLYA